MVAVRCNSTATAASTTSPGHPPSGGVSKSWKGSAPSVGQSPLRAIGTARRIPTRSPVRRRSRDRRSAHGNPAGSADRPERALADAGRGSLPALRDTTAGWMAGTGRAGGGCRAVAPNGDHTESLMTSFSLLYHLTDMLEWPLQLWERESCQ